MSSGFALRLSGIDVQRNPIQKQLFKRFVLSSGLEVFFFFVIFSFQLLQHSLFSVSDAILVARKVTARGAKCRIPVPKARVSIFVSNCLAFTYQSDQELG